MSFTELAKDRYSVRKFSSKPIEQNKIDTILDAAKVSPTAHNYQPYKILVINTPEGMEKLKNCTPFTFSAPTAFVVCYVTDEAWVREFDNTNAGVIDGSIIATHMMLQIHDLGLGTTWIWHFKPEVLKQDFNFPDGVEPVAIFPTGYPSDESKPSHLHEKRFPLSDKVFYETF